MNVSFHERKAKPNFARNHPIMCMCISFVFYLEVNSTYIYTYSLMNIYEYKLSCFKKIAKTYAIRTLKNIC